MAQTVAGLSVAALERLLSSRKTKLTRLTKRRKMLERRLQSLDAQIQDLQGRAANGTGVLRKRRKRPKNKMSLHEALVEVLKKNKRGYPLDALVDKVLASGYKTHSKNFKIVVYQTLYKSNEFELDKESGNYRLKD